MDKMINIPSTVQDDKYRYKMPAIQCKIESKGNGIRTSFPNIESVAHALRCDPDFIIKFFCVERGSQKKSSEKGFVINGSFTQEQMRADLDKFIEKYILCQGCRYPEIERKLEDENIIGICDACRWTGPLDTKHKVAKTIIKKMNEQVGTQKREAKQIIREKEARDKPLDKVVKEKVRRIRADELALDSPLLQEFLDQLVERRTALEAEGKEAEIVAAEMATLIKEFGVDKSLTDRYSYLSFQGTFTVNICKELASKAYILRYMYTKFKPADPTDEMMLNLALLVEGHPELEKYAVTVAKLMYDHELLVEEAFLRWVQSPPTAEHFLRQPDRTRRLVCLLRPFVEWLQAEEADDD
jgi:translation initiation factor 2 beta subunit (eIF-2beta)/eIF-5